MRRFTVAIAVEAIQDDVPIRGVVALHPRVLVADGQALVRAGVRLLLEAEDRITVVGEAATGEETLALVEQLRPDVVMMDTRLPGLDSVETTRRIVSESAVAVMLLTAGESDERIFAALKAGASGLLPKDTQPTQLVQAIEVLAQGEALLSPGLTRRLIDEFASRAEPSSPDPELLDELTAREREVVALVALGLSNGEIAERLVVSPATAKTHVSRAMVKLHAHDRAKLVVFAYEAGLVAARAVSAARVSRCLALA
jgi:DNA-binding NarL/FixJ family response regulator